MNCLVYYLAIQTPDIGQLELTDLAENHVVYAGHRIFCFRNPSSWMI